MGQRILNFFFVLFVFIRFSEARIQNLKFSKDDRSYIQLSSFGYLKGGSLTVTVSDLKTRFSNDIHKQIGFTLDKSSSEARSSYVEHQEDALGCVLNSTKTDHSDTLRAIMRLEKLPSSSNPEYQLAIYTIGLSKLQFEPVASLSKSNDEKVIDSSVKANKSKIDVVSESLGEKKISKEHKSDTTLPPKKGKYEKKQMPKVNKPSEKKIGKKAQISQDITNETAETKPRSKTYRKSTISPVNSQVHSNPKPSPPKNKNSLDNNSEDSNESSRKRRETSSSTVPEPTSLMYEHQGSIPVKTTVDSKGFISFSLAFSSQILTDEQEGLYELYFHNCRSGHGHNAKPISGFINITEKNKDNNYLSAGDIALPVLYAVMSSLFFFMAFQWISVLCMSKGKVFIIHYLMAVLVIIKGLSLAFHSIDLYFISKDGTPETWAIIFYVVHLLKGVLLFICLLLIGTGWAFIKYVLSDREKKLFMIVIPLQIFANIAYIVIHDTSESSKTYYTWKNVWMLVDILCCAAILAPVVWSVRHLQEASQTDGKAAINLQKLKLFQHFYVMIICYLYFTRLIVYLLEITLPFQLIWVHMLFSELGALVFFFLTGYQFRPGCDNPYLSIPQDDGDFVESLALTESGATETVSRVNKHDRDYVEDTTEEDLLLPQWRVAAAKQSKV